jgi:hypothetical protein
MDAVTIRVLAGVAAVLVLFFIIWRRNKKTAE